jgi:oligoendopeptidase F
MITKNHIDAAVRKGKRNGAYCDTWNKGKSAFILLSFTGALNEIYTLAHELGHAIHAYLASRIYGC